MIPARAFRGALLCLTLLAAACADTADPESATPSAGSPAALRPEYIREYVFVGQRGGNALVVPFSFRASDNGRQIERTARGWLAHEATWDPFLTEEWTTPRQTGVWRVLPRGRLQIAAHGPIDLSAIWFEKGGRRLRIDFGTPLSGWSQGDDARYRFRDAELRLGDETVAGAAVEVLRIRRPSTRASGEDYDWLFLTSGDSLLLLVTESMGDQRSAQRTFGWALRGGAERRWDEAEVRWVEMTPLEKARRDVPLRWRYRIPEAGIHGEVSALGYDVAVGEERGGRRGVELRYTVEGWVEIGGIRRPVIGTIRHNQG